MLGNKRGFKHGHGRQEDLDPTYGSWRSMHDRCLYPTYEKWKRYGGANPPVVVCEHWRGLHGFEHFLADMGERPEGTTLGRFGDIGNYSCGHCGQCNQNGWELNCEWQTDQEQKAEQKIKKQLKFLAVRGDAK
jgi:hypothetical protein